MMTRKKVIRNVMLAACAGASLNAVAVPFTLDFEGVGNGAQILDFYNGGTDSFGNSGTDYGVSFGTNALGVVDKDAGGDGNFANEPTPDTIMFFLTGSSILNYAPGFDTGFSFYYTTSQNAFVTVWDDVGATGNMLGQINLFKNNTANGCQGDPMGGPGDPSGQFCNFDVGFLSFNGLAKSIDFSGTANQVGFDNITFGSIDPNQSEPEPPVGVPEPASFALLGLGLLGLRAARRKK